jgi:hypothetical protein
MGRPALTSDIAHSTAGDVAAIALQYAPGLDQLLAELGLDLRRARRPFAIGIHGLQQTAHDQCDAALVRGAPPATGLR